MARIPRKHPKPNLRKRGECYELRWFWKGKLFEIRLGNIKKHQAEIIRDATAVALAGAADFPEEVKAEPALKRYLVLQAGIASESSDATLIHMYTAHLKAQSLDSQWSTVVKYHLNSTRVSTSGIPLYLSAKTPHFNSHEEKQWHTLKNTHKPMGLSRPIADGFEYIRLLKKFSKNYQKKNPLALFSPCRVHAWRELAQVGASLRSRLYLVREGIGGAFCG